MNFYKLALWLAAASIVFLFLVIFSPTDYCLLQWKNLVLTAGILFVYLLISWVCALVSLALNFVYAEKLFFIHEKTMPKLKKYLPAILCIPAAISFLWFCYKFYLGINAR